jgi:tetrahydrodipicolinate N-succinyltransferase
MTKKLDKEHLDAIQELQQQFATNASWLGSVAIELKMLERQQAQTESQHAELISQFDKLREQEQQLMAEREAERERQRQESHLIEQQVTPMHVINLAPAAGGRRRTMKSRRRKLSKKRKSKTKTKRKRN